MKNTQAFSKLRKRWVQITYHFPLNLLIDRKCSINYKNEKAKKLVKEAIYRLK